MSWAQTRLAVIDRDKRCQDCGEHDDQFHVHHVRGRVAGGTDEPTNLVLLCRACHKQRHRHRTRSAAGTTRRYVFTTIRLSTIDRRNIKVIIESGAAANESAAIRVALYEAATRRGGVAV